MRGGGVFILFGNSVLPFWGAPYQSPASNAPLHGVSAQQSADEQPVLAMKRDRGPDAARDRPRSATISSRRDLNARVDGVASQLRVRTADLSQAIVGVSSALGGRTEGRHGDGGLG